MKRFIYITLATLMLVVGSVFLSHWALRQHHTDHQPDTPSPKPITPFLQSPRSIHTIPEMPITNTLPKLNQTCTTDLSLRRIDASDLRQHNHTNLLAACSDVLTYLRQFSEEDRTEFSRPNWEQWSQYLYHDAILTALLSPGLSPEYKKRLQHALHDSDAIDNDLLTISPLPKDYLNQLIPLLSYASTHDPKNLDPRHWVTTSIEFKNLLKKRKWQSNVYYMSQIKTFLSDDTHNVEEKISFAKKHLLLNDPFLHQYIASYFLKLSEHRQLTDREKIMVADFITTGRLGDNS